MEYKYKKLTPFKMQCLTNFPFIDEDFDALSNYGLLCKIVEYINEVSKNNNTLIDNIESLNNWFKNLDVQNEINNKLDDMAESGQLQEIIGEYVNLKSILVFDSVSDMKNANNLVNGSVCKTLGFYNKNDGGESLYKIKTLTSDVIIDEMLVLSLLENTLVAELICYNEINVKQLGAKGDGIQDETDIFQTAFNNYNVINIPKGTYMIDAVKRLYPDNNNIINLDNSAKLKAITNSNTHYDILRIQDKSNIIISGGIIEGERDSHTGIEGEWGFCISIINSSNIYIHDITLKNSWGDGLYINVGNNIKTQNIICDNNRRQGLSIISVNGYHSLNDRFINTNGTNPQAGVDIEPNKATDVLKNIVFDNPYTENNLNAGIKLYLFNIESDEIDITINNHIDNSSIEGLNIAKSNLTGGRIIVNNPSYYNNKHSGIQLRDCYISDCDVIINRPYIKDCNTDNLSPAYVAGIGCYTSISTELSMGGITIIEPYITMYDKTTSNKNAIYMGDTTNNNPIENVKIINPLNKQSNLRINFGGSKNILFSDKYEKFISTDNYNLTLQNSFLYSKYYNNKFTSSRTYTISQYMAIGTILEFIYDNLNNKSLTIDFPDTNYVRYFDYSNPGIKLILSNYGNRIKLKKVSDTEWEVIEVLGEITKEL